MYLHLIAKKSHSKFSDEFPEVFLKFNSDNYHKTLCASNILGFLAYLSVKSPIEPQRPLKSELKSNLPFNDYLRLNHKSSQQDLLKEPIFLY